MSRIQSILDEAKTKAGSVEKLTNKVVISYNEDDLLDALKQLRSYPGAGIVYEGMRSVPMPGSTSKVGVSAEITIAIVLVQQGDAIVPTQQKKTIMHDLLEDVREVFLGQRSTVTNHYWNFLVEAPAALTSGMVCWVQRWTLPVQLSPTRPPQ